MRAALILLSACTTGDAIEAGTGESPADLIARECKERHLECALVYAFDAPADNPLGRTEMCTREQDLPAAMASYGAYELSPDARFQKWKALGVDPVCVWSCSEGGLSLCNAYSGCYCPEVSL